MVNRLSYCRRCVQGREVICLFVQQILIGYNGHCSHKNTALFCEVRLWWKVIYHLQHISTKHCDVMHILHNCISSSYTLIFHLLPSLLSSVLFSSIPTFFFSFCIYSFVLALSSFLWFHFSLSLLSPFHCFLLSSSIYTFLYISFFVFYALTIFLFPFTDCVINCPTWVFILFLICFLYFPPYLVLSL